MSGGDGDREEEKARDRDSPQLSSVRRRSGRLSGACIWQEGVLGSGPAGGKAGQQQEDARWREGTQEAEAGWEQRNQASRAWHQL